jgi:myo-inositol-1(or 4)-monophosphatase
MQPMLHVATTAARAAAKIILTGLDRIDSVRIEEKRKHDFVTSVDKAAETEIIRTLQQAYPDHHFLSEEGFADTPLTDKGSYWIIDPLDGTMNFIQRIPHFAISIAYYEAGKVEMGLVYDPIRDELFTAIRGKGARLNQSRLRVGQKRKLAHAFLATGMPHHTDMAGLASIQTVLPQVAGMRKMGAASLDLAYVAAGRFDAYIDKDLQVWDTAAGNLLVQESGGYVRDFAGAQSDVTSSTLIAANPDLYTALQSLMAG